MCEWIHICSDIDSEQDMDKITRTFGDLVRRIICYMWIHICSDIGSGEDTEKATRTFLCFRNKAFLLTFELPKNIHWDCNFHVSEQHSEHCDTIHLPPTISAKIYYLWMKTQDSWNCDKVKHLVARGRGSKGQDFM